MPLKNTKTNTFTLKKRYRFLFLSGIDISSFEQIPNLPTSQSVRNSANSVFTLQKIGIQSKSSAKYKGYLTKIFKNKRENSIPIIEDK